MNTIQAMNPGLYNMASQNAMSMGTQHWGSMMPQISNQMQQLQTAFPQMANTFTVGQGKMHTFGQNFQLPGGGNMTIGGFGFLNAPHASTTPLAQSVEGQGNMGQGLLDCLPPGAKGSGLMQQYQQMIQQMMQVLSQIISQMCGVGQAMNGPMAQTGHMGGELAGRFGGFGANAEIGGTMKAGIMGGFMMGGAFAKGKAEAKPRPRPQLGPEIGGRDDDGGGSGGFTGGSVAVGGGGFAGVGIGEGGDGGDGGGDGGDGGDGGGGDGGGDGDPLAFDLNGDGKIGVTGASTAQVRKGNYERGRTVDFDLDGDGKLDRTEWMAGDGDGLLVDNSDGRASEDMNGTRLFGDEGGTYKDGIAKLKLRDANNDGKISGEELKGLEMWVDDGDAKVENGEMKTLEELGITEISVERNVVKNDRGEELMRSTATRADGSKIMTEDVWWDGDFSKKGEI
jgi:hypothetical protein